MIDSHSHSKFSHDGHNPISEMVQRANELGMSYYAITEHLDRDYMYSLTLKFCKQLDVAGYEKAREEFLKTYEGNAYVAFGMEAGHSKKSIKRTQASLEGQDLDLVINSIHSIQGQDPYTGGYFVRTRTRSQRTTSTSTAYTKAYSFHTNGK